MYNVGDKIVYGLTGACEVLDIKPLEGVKGADKGRLYYILKPIGQNGKIYSPVDSDKVFMRPIMSREQAQELVRTIPEIKAEAYSNSNLQLLAEHYKELLGLHNTEALVELTMSIYAKKKSVEQQKRKFGQVDEAFMKQAEELLFGELSVALDIPREQIPDYIASEIAAVTGE